MGRNAADPVTHPHESDKRRFKISLLSKSHKYLYTLVTYYWLTNRRTRLQYFCREFDR